ncbi:MAG TPA: IS1595 family transposase [Planctomycetota bacterium]|nr:IS1595 family transposase [Planctomycetota bacterium]
MNSVELFADFPGLALLAEACSRDEEFERCFGTEEDCREWFFRARWPTGFVCPRCGGHVASWRPSRRVWQCASCRKQTSLTAGTLLQGTKKPLRTWLEAAYLVVQRGVNAKTLQRKLGLTYKVAWAWSHKLRAAMRPIAIPESAGPHERYEYDASRTRGGGTTEPHPARREPCACSRLRARDWGFPNEMQEEWDAAVAAYLWKRFGERRFPVLPEDAPPAPDPAGWELQATYGGSVTEKHLRAYLDELAFRGNRRRRAIEDAFRELARSLAWTRPRSYTTIVACPEPTGNPLSIFARRRRRPMRVAMED